MRQGKYASDQVRVENEQSKLRLKDEIATRKELESPIKAACEGFESRMKTLVINKGRNIE